MFFTGGTEASTFQSSPPSTSWRREKWKHHCHTNYSHDQCDPFIFLLHRSTYPGGNAATSHAEVASCWLARCIWVANNVLTCHSLINLSIQIDMNRNDIHVDKQREWGRHLADVSRSPPNLDLPVNQLSQHITAKRWSLSARDVCQATSDFDPRIPSTACHMLQQTSLAAGCSTSPPLIQAKKRAPCSPLAPGPPHIRLKRCTGNLYVGMRWYKMV